MFTVQNAIRKGVAIVSVLGMTLANVGPAFASSSSTIDFEGLAEGLVVSSLSFGAGISGDNAGGSVAVFGVNPAFPAGTNAAVIFDAECLPAGTPAGCTGGDADLFQPGLGNVLIVQEAFRDGTIPVGIVADPNDTDNAGAMMTFDFSGWGSGVVSVNSLTVLDVESDEPGGMIEVWAGGALQGSVGIPVTGNGGKATVPIGFTGDFLKVTLGGSGAIDNIEIATEDEGAEGCTPGYWKNHTDVWTTYTPGQRVDSVFTVPGSLAALADDTLLEALNYGGGKGVDGGARIMLRAAVAALLNASSPGVDYPLTTGEVIAQVNAALASLNRETMINLGADLDTMNNLGSPFCD